MQLVVVMKAAALLLHIHRERIMRNAILLTTRGTLKTKSSKNQGKFDRRFIISRSSYWKL